MKHLLTIALALVFASSLLAGDGGFYYQIETPPRTIPGIDGTHDGIMIFVRRPAAEVTVCAEYYTVADLVSRSACAVFPADQTHEWTPTRLDFQTGAENFRLTRLTVSFGDTSKSIDSPSAGVEY